MNSSEKSPFSFKKRASSFRYAFKGLRIFFSTQHNAWVHAFIAVLVIAFGIFLKITAIEWILISFSIGLVLLTEMINTAIEFLVDKISPGFNEQAGTIKDLAAGSVLLASITSAIVGLIIFLPKLLKIVV